MFIPAAMNIYQAQEMLRKMDPKWREDQLREFRSASPAASDDLQAGYELGLATARSMLYSSVKLRLAGIDPQEVL